MSKLIVRGFYESDKPGGPDLEQAFEKFVAQIGRDVISGTFDDYDRSIFKNQTAFDAFRTQSKVAASAFSGLEADGIKRGRFQFRLELDPALFADPTYGLQRLVHTLASDLFERRVHDYDGKVNITEIDFGDVRDAMEAAYRPSSHKRADIQQAFALKPNRPLLAFSLKPRGGLTDDDYVHLATAAFNNGCNIVELDTRDLALDPADRLNLFVRLSRLGIERSKKRVCRFAANLSGPTRVVGPIVEELSKVHDGKGPFVVKVDGNLDGLSTIQAIRAGAFAISAQPIITCYPVLKYALQPALGRNAFVQMLAMSGADIIYPGQSPDFGSSNNRIDTQRVGAAQAHYRAMGAGEYPMLSVAGGIFINQVHACLSLLGSDIAFFAGGGIALSKKGIANGAANFAKAIELSCQDLFDGVKIRNLADKLVELSEVYFENDQIPANYELILPSAIKNVELIESTNLQG